MKKIIPVFVLFFALSLIGCTNVQGNQTDEELKGDKTNTVSTSTAAGEVEFLTYDTFLEKVWNFEESPQEWIYEGDVPCVIDFYADWCKPCKMVAPIMDDLAKEYDGKLKVYKINVDKEKKLASVFQVRSIPAVLFSPMQGRPIMQAGALPKDQYVKIIQDELFKK